MKTDIEIVRGTTNTFDITVTDAFGQLYTLSANETLLFGVKRTPEDIDYIFVKSVKVGDNGVYSVVLHPEDTEQCNCCRYYYDVSIQSGDDFYNVIETSSFNIAPNITKKGCG